VWLFYLKNLKIDKNIINIYLEYEKLFFKKSNFDYINNILKNLIKSGENKFKISCEIKKLNYLNI